MYQNPPYKEIPALLIKRLIKKGFVEWCRNYNKQERMDEP